MKTVVLSAGHAQPHAGWLAIDELAEQLAHYLGATLLAPRRRAGGWSWRQPLARPGRVAWEPLPPCEGDLLIVVAHAPQDLAMIEALPDVRRRFGRIVGWVTDSYFGAGFGRATAQYDLLTVTAHEDAALPRDRFGVRTEVVVQGADCLTWAPPPDAPRAIDLIGFGRLPPSVHQGMVQAFHTAGSPHLYLHSPLGHIDGPSVRVERAMLFKLLQRSRVALAYHLFVEPQGQRPRSMMVTSRWLESLLAGCLVAGRRPVSRMADEMLCWPGATVELDADPRAAAVQVQALFADSPALAAQRRRNVAQMLRRHDWRHRVQTLAGLYGATPLPCLQDDLARVHALADLHEAGLPSIDAAG